MHILCLGIRNTNLFTNRVFGTTDAEANHEGEKGGTTKTRWSLPPTLVNLLSTNTSSFIQRYSWFVRRLYTLHFHKKQGTLLT